MASSSSWDLQQSVYNFLINDATITNLLGGQSVYDDVPQRAGFPYITFGRSTVRDWSTGTEPGNEHVLSLHIWSKAAGKKETYEIIDAICTRLQDNSLQLSDHHLVNFRCEFSEARRTVDGEKFHGIVRYRAVTEPLV